MKSIKRSVSIFVGMAILFAVLVLTANHLADSFGQLMVVSVASAIFGSGLTFFLLQALNWEQRK